MLNGLYLTLVILSIRVDILLILVLSYSFLLMETNDFVYILY